MIPGSDSPMWWVGATIPMKDQMIRYMRFRHEINGVSKVLSNMGCVYSGEYSLGCCVGRQRELVGDHVIWLTS